VWCWYGRVPLLSCSKRGDFWGDSWGDSFWDRAVISMGCVPKKARSLGVSRAAGDSQVQLVLSGGIIWGTDHRPVGLHQRMDQMARKTPGDDETGTTPAKGSRPSRAKRHLAVVAGTDTAQVSPKAKPTTGGSVGTSKGASPTGTRRKSGKNLLLGLTTKQEAFAEAVVSGKSLSAAYREAYDAKGMTDEAVRVEASRLLIHPNVSLRVKSLNLEKEDQRRMLAVNRAERVLERLEKLADNAKSESAKIRANELIGKTAGLFIEQIEVSDTTDRSTSDIERSIAEKLARLGLTG